MTDELQTGSEMEQTAQTGETLGGEQTEAQTTQTETESGNDDLEAIKAALKKANKEAAANRKKLEAFEKAEQDRKDAELSETERLQKQLAERETELKTLRINELKRQAAAKYSLPDALANRLQGETLEELEQDAETLSKTLPKASPKMGATNPGAGPAKQTEDELKQSLFGRKTPIFDAGYARQHGGGVFEVTHEEG